MYDCPDHPDIVAIERTGYPSWMKEEDDVFCEECGEDITDYDERYYDEKHEHLCERCLKFLHKKDW
jgi:formylmethanofuran dehydrogenase subunit E